MPSQHVRASAWLEHSSFVFWLVDLHRPNTMVELGVHNGFSFLSLCQIAKSVNLNTSIYAIDTWEGDEHAGFYDSKIFDELETEVQKTYPKLARMMKSTFAEARSDFANGSVDLLHIDGRHRYEDVKGDFDDWLETLSNRGVVLFHDTCVRRDDFGVFKFWSEISQLYPSFEFFHGNGLGVLLVGDQAPEELKKLCSEGPEVKNFVRDAYARLGQINSLIFGRKRMASEQHRIQTELRANIAELTRDNAKIHNLLHDLNSENAALHERLGHIELENKSILKSTSWKITKPLRKFKSLFLR